MSGPVVQRWQGWKRVWKDTLPRCSSYTTDTPEREKVTVYVSSVLELARHTKLEEFTIKAIVQKAVHKREQLSVKRTSYTKALTAPFNY